MNKTYLLCLLGASMILVAMMVIGKGAPNTTPVSKDKSPVLVGVIYPGSVDDNGWNEVHHTGIQQMKQNMNVEFIEKQNVSDRDASIKLAVDGLAKQGVTIIFAVSYNYELYLGECAEKYPEIEFFHAAGVKSSKNVTSYMGRMYQPRYLTGIVAGRQTQSDEIGFVASFPTVEVIRGINAFTLGVRSVNKDAVVHVAWSGEWSLPKAEQSAVDRLLKKHTAIDMITMHQNTYAVLQRTHELKIDSIGYHIDERERFPDTFLTAPVWSWGDFYQMCLTKYMMGQFNGTYYWNGIETGLVDIAPLSDKIGEETKKEVYAARKKIIDGTWDVFYGPIYDQNGILMVDEGENLSDQYLLEEMNWFVEGVEAESIEENEF